MLKTDELKVVNPMPYELLGQVHEVIRAVEENKKQRSRDTLSKRPFVKYLAKGACGFVFQICEDFIIKVNDVGTNFNLDRLRDGQIMESLQGLPFIPKLYAYTPDNKYIIMQRIKGRTTEDFRWNEEAQKKYKPTEFDTDTMFGLAKELYNGALERGWVLKDLHEENTMVSPEGFFVVDVGLFKTTEQADSFEAQDQLNNLLWSLKRVAKEIGAPEPSKEPRQVLDELRGIAPKPAQEVNFVVDYAKAVKPSSTSFDYVNGCSCERCEAHFASSSSTGLSWLLGTCTTEPESTTLSYDFFSSLFGSFDSSKTPASCHSQCNCTRARNKRGQVKGEPTPEVKAESEKHPDECTCVDCFWAELIG